MKLSILLAVASVAAVGCGGSDKQVRTENQVVTDDDGDVKQQTTTTTDDKGKVEKVERKQIDIHDD